MKTLSLAAFLGLSVAGAYAQAPKVNFNDHISPIFRNACTNCHNPDKKKAGLDLTTYQGTMAGGESGPAIKPGNGDGSLLYKLSAHIDEPKMPPKGDKMSEAELKLLKDWIAGFALENANSKPTQVAANKVDVAVVSLTRPDGPPPMPGDLPLEPFVKARGKTAVLGMAASPWAPLVAVGGEKQVTLFHTDTAEPLGVLNFPEGFPQVLKFSRNAKLLLAAGGLGGKSGKVVMWDVATGERAGTVGNESDAVLAADISPDHQFVALGGPEKRVKIFQTKDGKQTGLIKKHTEWITAVAYSPDGKYLATADRNGGVEIWESGADPKPFNTLAGHKSACVALAFMPGVLASAGEDGKVILWNVKEGTEIKNWTAHAGGVQWVEFSPDGKLATCGRDKTAKIWDQTGKQLAATEAFADLTTRCTINTERVIAADWTGAIGIYGHDGKKISALSANPPGIGEQLAAAEKVLAENNGALPGLQKAVADTEAKLKAELEAAEAKRKADLAAAEARKAEAWKNFEAAKAAPASAEKALQDLTAQAQAAKEAVQKAETALTEKKKAAAASGDSGKAAKDLEAAKKKLAELTSEIEKRREARAKLTAGTPEYQKADEAVQALKPELARAEQVLEGMQGKVNTTQAPNPADVDAARAALAEAQKQAEALKQQVQKAQQAFNQAKSAAPRQIAEAEKAVGAADAEIGKLKNPPGAAPAPAAPTNNAKVAEAQKRVDALTAEVAKAREARAKHAEGSPEYNQANEVVQARKAELAKAGEALASAQSAPAAPAPAAPAPAAPVSETGKALAKAKADLDAANARIVSAKSNLDRWKRAQLYQTVFNARQTVAEKQTKYDDLVATAKDAFRQVEMTRQAVTAAEQSVADAPKTLAAREAALAEVKKLADAANAAIAAAEKAVADKKAEQPDPKKIEAEIADLQKQTAAITAEREKLKEERAKFAEGSPDYAAIQKKRDDLKAKQAPIDGAIEAAKARLAAKPGANVVPPELLEAVKKAQLDAKLAGAKLAPAEKALADAKKSVEDAKKQIPELKARIPQLEADAARTKSEAEKSAAALAKELQAAKAHAEKLRAQFEAAKASASTAAAGQPKS